MEYKKEFKSRLDDIRKSVPMSVADQAKEIGISRPTMDLVLDEESKAGLQNGTIRKIKEYLKKQEAHDNN